MTLYNDASRIAVFGLTLAFAGLIAASANKTISSMFGEPKGASLLPATGADAYTPEAIFSRARRYFGITTNPREAGYIMPDGTMLDFSGRRFGGSGGERTMDHREIAFSWPEEDSPGGFESMKRVMNWGAVRFTIFSTIMVVDTAVLLTPSQERTIDQAIRKYPDAVLVVEVDTSDLYQIDYRNFEYPFTGWKSFIKETLSDWSIKRTLVAATIPESESDYRRKVEQVIDFIQQSVDETRKSDSIKRIEMILDRSRVEHLITGAGDLRRAIADYQAIEREGLTSEDYQQEKEAAFEEVIDAVEGLDIDEDAFEEYLPLAIPRSDLQRIAEKYGWWAAKLAESVCPYNDVACVEREAKRLSETRMARRR